LPEDDWSFSFQDWIRGTHTTINAFENIKLTGIDKNNIFGYTLLKESEITGSREFKQNLQTINESLPFRNMHVDYYVPARWISTDSILELKKGMPEYANEITIRYETPIGSDTYVQYIRPPKNERLYPTKYSKANGKG